jgi:3-demethoxyubiquinol 3-hydroxylase
MAMPEYSLADRLVLGLDSALRTLSGQHQAGRPNPAGDLPEAELSEAERADVAGMMRVNHAGEVCAQALYEGQALTARDPTVREALLEAAAEEIDHLAWCKARLDELNDHTSVLDPLWFGASYSLGAMTGLLGDRASLGFVEATEDQVCQHLELHMARLPESDQRTRAILEQMCDDERRHGDQALAAGGAEFPPAVKSLMRLVSRVMTETSYRI